MGALIVVFPVQPPPGRHSTRLPSPRRPTMEVARIKDFQWKALAPLSKRRVYCSSVEVGGQVFAIGGCDDNGIPMHYFEVYSPKPTSGTPSLPCLRPRPPWASGSW
ncbi:PREDICTED: kelch domain-containing protein 8A-like [Gavialis gangeticus]|uniref:kelch domain-containing protein 8A-like n=1 Tax=Gavialis gangeticus TaxID=94835 RepID=UPI00092EE8D9|nr:PREDICTED: kelch domain-containing protein 8A-like [Gavialis gangeticus]